MEERHRHKSVTAVERLPSWLGITSSQTSRYAPAQPMWVLPRFSDTTGPSHVGNLRLRRLRYAIQAAGATREHLGLVPMHQDGSADLSLSAPFLRRVAEGAPAGPCVERPQPVAPDKQAHCRCSKTSPITGLSTVLGSTRCRRAGQRPATRDDAPYLLHLARHISVDPTGGADGDSARSPLLAPARPRKGRKCQ